MYFKKTIVTALILFALITTVNAAYYVSPEGSGNHTGLTKETAFNLSEAQDYANTKPNEEITFLLKSGNYGEFNDTVPERTAWAIWKADVGQTPVFSSMKIGRWDGPFNKYLQFEEITVQASAPLGIDGVLITFNVVNHVKFVNSNIITVGYSESDRSKGLFIRSSENIEVKGCKVYGIGPEPFSGVDYGIFGRNSNNVTIDGCDITKIGKGIIAWGRNWGIRNNTIHNLNADGILGANIADSVIEDNNIYDIIRPAGSEHHTDGIQLFNAGGVEPGHVEYVYVENIIIRRNRIYNVVGGQLMLWNGFIPEVEGGPGSKNILVEDNLMYNAEAVEFHVDDTENLRVINNTIIGSAIFRSGIKEVHVENNIVNLMNFYINEGVTVAYENYNIVNQWGAQNAGHVQGSNTILLENEDEFYNLFVDSDVNDFRLKQGQIIGEPPNISDPCFMSSTGSYVGSQGCIGCGDDSPIAIFTPSSTYGYEPLSVLFDASYSLACDNSISSYEWDFGDNTTGQGENVSHTYAAGVWSPSLTVENTVGKSNTLQKEITVLPSAVPNLVLYLNFDNSVTDLSGKNNHGEWQGVESFEEGITGQATSMDGTSNGTYVLVDSDETLDGINQLTISVWAKKNDAEIGETILLKHLGYHLSIESDRIYTYLFNSLDTRLNLSKTTEDIHDDEWHHYALTYDGSTAKIYLDSQEIASAEFSGAIAENPTRDIYIGKNPWGNNFNGLIDELRIYDRGLNSEEILALYENDKPECVDLTALTNYISQWKQGNLSMSTLLHKIGNWKAGTGC